MCSDARQKFTEAETRSVVSPVPSHKSVLLSSLSLSPSLPLSTRIRKGDRKLFESSQSLEKTYNKCAERLKQCQKKIAVARNDYLLAITTTNAHLHRHSTEDLPALMKVCVCVCMCVCE